MIIPFAITNIKKSEIIMKDNPTKTKILECFSRWFPIKIKIPPPTPTNKISIPEITVSNSAPVVKGVNIPDARAAIAIM